MDAAAIARVDDLKAQAQKIIDDEFRRERLEALAKLPEGWEARAKSEFVAALKRGDQLGRVDFGDGLIITFAAGAMALRSKGAS